MGKRITTRWYVGAWLVYLIALVAVIMAGRGVPGHASPPAGIMLGYLVLLVSGVVMFVMWIGALVRLAMQEAWGWFLGVVISHLVGLGIVGMVAYAISGPEDAELVATRPSTPTPG